MLLLVRCISQHSTTDDRIALERKPCRARACGGARWHLYTRRALLHWRTDRRVPTLGRKEWEQRAASRPLRHRVRSSRALNSTGIADVARNARSHPVRDAGAALSGHQRLLAFAAPLGLNESVGGCEV